MSTASSIAVERRGSRSRFFCSRRSAARRMGVSGFLISWAMRRAASLQAASCWALISSVRSSMTSTRPRSAPSAPRIAVTLASKVFHSPPRTRCTSWLEVAAPPAAAPPASSAASLRRSGSAQASAASRPSTSSSRWRRMFNAAPLQVKMRPAASVETTPAATFSSTAAISARSPTSRWLVPVQLAVAALEQLLVAPQLLGHAVEGADEHPQLVVGVDVDAVGEVAAADPPRPLGERLDGDGHPPRQVEPHPRRGEEDQERDHQEDQQVAGAEVVLLHLELAEGLEVAGPGRRSCRRGRDRCGCRRRRRGVELPARPRPWWAPAPRRRRRAPGARRALPAAPRAAPRAPGAPPRSGSRGRARAAPGSPPASRPPRGRTRSPRRRRARRGGARPAAPAGGG